MRIFALLLAVLVSLAPLIADTAKAGGTACGSQKGKNTLTCGEGP